MELKSESGLNKKVNRRDFVKQCAWCGLAVGAGAGFLTELLPPLTSPANARQAWEGDLKEARYYKKLELKKVKCELCPRLCVVDDQERGFCGVRENRGGTYYTLVYSNPCAVHIDPIEKKPFFHFLPATRTFSLATAGCNIDCAYCQNWEISQRRPEQVRAIYLPPARVVKEAKRTGCESISFTYTEPVIFYEYMVDIAVLARKQGIKSVMVTNAYIESEPMKEACRHLDAVKVDFKGFSEKFYREVCRGSLKPVLEALKTIKETGIWLEIVTLIVPALNDSPDELRRMCAWVKKNLGADIPISFSRFIPLYKLKNLPMTPVSTLEMARRIALEAGLKYAYIGNVSPHPAESTYCPKCGKVVIRRVGFYSDTSNLCQGKCGSCGFAIPGIWS